MRMCRCGRPLEDPEYHDITVIVDPLPPIVGWHKGQIVRGDVLISEGVRVFECKMRLIAESPITGKRLVPKSTQRYTQINIRHGARNARFVHPELLEEAA